MPDYGTIIIEYEPRLKCLELKALKHYLLAYRNLGIFYENAVNRILRDIVAATKPVWCTVRGRIHSSRRIDHNGRSPLAAPKP